MRYDLSYRTGRHAYKIIEDTREGLAVSTALDALSSIKAGRYFEALGQTFQILKQRKYTNGVYVSFMKTTRKK